jgi:hypothetical protein
MRQTLRNPRPAVGAAGTGGRAVACCNGSSGRCCQALCLCSGLLLDGICDWQQEVIMQQGGLRKELSLKECAPEGQLQGPCVLHAAVTITHTCHSAGQLQPQGVQP